MCGARGVFDGNGVPLSQWDDGFLTFATVRWGPCLGCTKILGGGEEGWGERRFLYQQLSTGNTSD